MYQRSPENMMPQKNKTEESPNIIEGHVCIGNNCQLEGPYSLGYLTAIDNGVSCNRNLKTERDCLIKDGANLGINVYLHTNSVIGRDCIIGNHVTVHSGSRIPDGTIILDYGNVYPNENDPENEIIVYYPEKELNAPDSSEFDI